MGLGSRERELEIFGSHGCVFQDLPEIIYYCLFLQSGQLDPKQWIEQEALLEEGVQALMDMDNCSPAGIVMITQFFYSEHL